MKAMSAVIMVLGLLLSGCHHWHHGHHGHGGDHCPPGQAKKGNC